MPLTGCSGAEIRLPFPASYLAPEGVPRDTQRFRITRERWRASARDPVEIVGLEPCLELFGLPAGGTAG